MILVGLRTQIGIEAGQGLGSVIVPDRALVLVLGIRGMRRDEREHVGPGPFY